MNKYLFGGFIFLTLLTIVQTQYETKSATLN